jgi:ActR/RegA family two-component response regulator
VYWPHVDVPRGGSLRWLMKPADGDQIVAAFEADAGAAGDTSFARW